MCGINTVVFDSGSSRYKCAICMKVLGPKTVASFTPEQIKEIKSRTREEALRNELEEEMSQNKLVRSNA